MVSIGTGIAFAPGGGVGEGGEFVTNRLSGSLPRLGFSGLDCFQICGGKYGRHCYFFIFYFYRDTSNFHTKSLSSITCVPG